MTPTEVARALYASEDAQRFFLIADGVFLPLGRLTLRSMTGGLRAVDPEVARAYEITAAHARRLMKGAITGALGEASEAVQQLGILLAVFGKAAETDVLVLDEERRRSERAARLASVLGVSPDEADDREVVRGRLAEVLIELEAELRSADVMRRGADAAAFRAHFQRIMQLAAEEVAAEHDPFAGTMPLALRQAFQDHSIQQRLREVAVLLQSTREAVEDVDDADLDV
jgi:hypothetical protein